jgi:hypothetical protein
MPAKFTVAELVKSFGPGSRSGTRQEFRSRNSSRVSVQALVAELVKSFEFPTKRKS